MPWAELLHSRTCRSFPRPFQSVLLHPFPPLREAWLSRPSPPRPPMASLWKAPEGKARPCRCQKGPHGPPNPGCSLPAPSLAHTLAGRGARLSWRRPRPGMCPQQQERRRARLPDATAGTTRAPSPHSATPQPRPATGTLTEHGHELLGVEVPVAPVGPVAVQRGVLLVVVRRFRPEGVDDPDPAPAPGDGEPQTLPGPGVPQPWVVPCEESLGSHRAV